MSGLEITDIFWALTWAPGYALMFASFRRVTGRAPWAEFWLDWATGGGGTAIAVLAFDLGRPWWWLLLLISAAHVAFALLMRWWRRKGRRAAATLGAKSRALRDALVRKVRELTPRPALRPVPVPA